MTNYISALDWDKNSELFQNFWPANIHLIGKDISRFHGVFWPAFLFSAGIDIPKMIFSHGFLLNKGEKMSKSTGNTVDPFEMVKIYGVDQLRFYLLSSTPFGKDGNYSHELIKNHSNAMLSNDLGNLSQRCLKLVYTKCEERTPTKGIFNKEDIDLINKTYDLYPKCVNLMNNYQIHSYINEVFNIVSDANKYFSEQKPWKLDLDRMYTVLWVTCEVLRVISIMLQPIITESASKLLDSLAINLSERSFKNCNKNYELKSGVKITEPEAIFPRI